MVSGNHILIAVSGGADSVALLHLMHEAARECRWRLTVAHLNHGIRGNLAGEDAAFVASLARQLRIPCVIGKARVPALAKRRGISLEMAAREARYAFLVRTARKVGADTIATAHTADDQAETVLLKLIRGAGRGGLSGIDRVSQVAGIRLVRPLLSMTRIDIEAFLRAQKISWREDASNRDMAFLRNRVRHALLPLLERDYNPKMREILLRTSDVLGAEDEWLDEMAGEILESARVKGALVGRSLAHYSLAARRRVIRLWLTKQGMSESCLDFEGVTRVEAVLSRDTGSETVDLSGGWQVRRHYDRISARSPDVRRRDIVNPVKSIRLTIPGVTLIPEWGLRVTVALAPGIVKERGGGPGVMPTRATLSGAVWRHRAVKIRLCRAGDRIAPYGITGSCKLQDIFVDAKVPSSERARIPLLECGRQVIWVPGYRIARDWAVEDGSKDNLQIGLAPIKATSRRRRNGDPQQG
jgi:tRNA(Ile)-lysidine synthase